MPDSNAGTRLSPAVVMTRTFKYRSICFVNLLPDKDKKINLCCITCTWIGYSYRSDSIGSFSAALFAGEYPKITPTAAETVKAITTEKTEITVVMPAIF
jgi:hypothetical protein